MGGLAHGGIAKANRVDAEAGYWLAVSNRLVGTSRIGFSPSEYGRDCRVGDGRHTNDEAIPIPPHALPGTISDGTKSE